VPSCWLLPCDFRLGARLCMEILGFNHSASPRLIIYGRLRFFLRFVLYVSLIPGMVFGLSDFPSSLCTKPSATFTLFLFPPRTLFRTLVSDAGLLTPVRFLSVKWPLSFRRFFNTTMSLPLSTIATGNMFLCFGPVGLPLYISKEPPFESSALFLLLFLNWQRVATTFRLWWHDSNITFFFTRPPSMPFQGSRTLST